MGPSPSSPPAAKLERLRCSACRLCWNNINPAQLAAKFYRSMTEEQKAALIKDTVAQVISEPQLTGAPLPPDALSIR